MFLGTYQHSIDPKGRLFIPAKLRGGVAEEQSGFILTRGLEMCLYLYDAKTFHDVVMSKLSDLPVKNHQDGRAFKRLLLAGAQDVTIDELGRVLIPKQLIEFADIKKDVAILGVGERIELWSAKRWDAYSERASSTFQKIGKQLEV